MIILCGIVVVILLLAIGYLLFARVHHFFPRHWHNFIHMHLFTLLGFASFATYFEPVFLQRCFLCFVQLFFSLSLFTFVWFWTFVFIRFYDKWWWNNKVRHIYKMMPTKENQMKIELNEIKIDSNTKNVNVITFSFTSVLWINATGNPFSFRFLFVGMLYGCSCPVVVPCRTKQCLVYRSVVEKRNGAHLIS